MLLNSLPNNSLVAKVLLIKITSDLFDQKCFRDFTYKYSQLKILLIIMYVYQLYRIHVWLSVLNVKFKWKKKKKDNMIIFQLDNLLKVHTKLFKTVLTCVYKLILVNNVSSKKNIVSIFLTNFYSNWHSLISICFRLFYHILHINIVLNNHLLLCPR